MKSRKTLILGSGGREHALAWHYKKSGRETFASPGSDAIKKVATVFQFDSFEDLAAKISERKIDEVVVGPEKYLEEGVADFLSQKGIRVIGPSKAAAQLESDKAWAKDFCSRHQIPQGKAATVKKSEELIDALNNFRPPYVIKASGLAAGKGVWIGENKNEAVEFGEKALKSHSSVVIEEFLSGEEISYFVAVDGNNRCFLGAAQDHKRLLENDLGPNTGGMGAYGPVPSMNEALQKKIEDKVVKPTISGLQKDGLPYCGFLFFGLMIVKGEPYVLEYNCRMGDPETQILMLQLKTPLHEIFDSLGEGKEIVSLRKPGMAMNVILAAKGYPEEPMKNFEMPGLDSPPKESVLFHSGTKWNGSHWTANGGRLFSINTLQPSLAECQEILYPWIESLGFLDKVTYRRDIGMNALKHLSNPPHERSLHA